jgi:hypothetical protein
VEIKDDSDKILPDLIPAHYEDEPILSPPKKKPAATPLEQLPLFEEEL